MRNKIKIPLGIKLLLMCIILLIMFFISLFIGRYSIEPIEVLKVLQGRLSGVPIEDLGQNASVIINIRLPRVILAMLIGSGMAISGATFQGLFKNPLVSPDVLGVTSGGGFGVALGILLGGVGIQVNFYAFAFGMLSVLVAYYVAKSRDRVSTVSLVLAGMVVSSIFSSLISLIKFVADPDEKLPSITYWLMGSLSKASFSDLKLVIIPIGVSIIILLCLRWRINILSLGDEEAYSLGINPKVIRFVAIILSTVITASSVMVVGVIGWVGLVIPHIARFFVGVDHKNLLPTAAILGAIFLALVDLCARSLTPAEIPIGILTALIGAPFFACLIKSTRKKEGDF